MKAQISKDGSTRSAIGRIVTAYQMVQTVRSALEGKAHLALPERGRIHRLLRCLFTFDSPCFYFFSEWFEYVISPQSMNNNDFLNRLRYEFSFTSQFAESEAGQRSDSSKVCHVNNTCISIRREGPEALNRWLLTRGLKHKVATVQVGIPGGGEGVVRRDRAGFADDVGI